MSGQVDALSSQARLNTARSDKAAPGSDRERLQKMAAEFESSLMLQMLREMRRASQFSDEEQDGGLKGSGSLIGVELTTTHEIHRRTMAFFITRPWCQFSSPMRLGGSAFVQWRLDMGRPVRFPLEEVGQLAATRTWPTPAAHQVGG